MTTRQPAHSSLNQIAGEVSDYYTATLAQHGATPRGVDWSCQPTQELRFIQLLRLCAFDKPFLLNDLGCGYGALRSFLRRRHRLADIDYLGVDLSKAMIDAARTRWRHLAKTRFESATASLRTADYSIASGLFNVRLHHPDHDWEPWVAHILQTLHAASRIGFAVNFLAPLQSGESSPRALYCPAIEQWKSYCENELQATVEPLMAYGLCEYTLLVRRHRAIPDTAAGNDFAGERGSAFIDSNC